MTTTTGASLSLAHEVGALDQLQFLPIRARICSCRFVGCDELDLLHAFWYLPWDLNFIDHTSDIGWKEFQRAKPVIVDPGLYMSKKADVFWITQRRSEPTAFKLITGTEAMFADLGHFSVRSIQISMCSLTYLALMCAYTGQAAYLRKNNDQVANTFYESIPHPIYWPMFVVAVGAAIMSVFTKTRDENDPEVQSVLEQFKEHLAEIPELLQTTEVRDKIFHDLAIRALSSNWSFALVGRTGHGGDNS